MSLLKKDITKKERVNEKYLSKLECEFEARDNKKYEVEVIIGSAMYDKKANNQMLSLYYHVLWKGYLDDKSI